MTYADALQWAGFACIVAGTWFYGSKPRVGAVFTAVGCVALGVWCGMVTPPAWGVMATQSVVCVLSIRNYFVIPRGP